MTSHDHKIAAHHALHLGDATEAITQMRAAVALSPADLSLNATLGEYLWANFEFTEALDIFTRVAKADADNSLLCAQVAQKFFSLGRFESAASLLELAVNRAPADAAIKTMLGEICERCDRLDAADRHAHEAIALDDTHVKAHRLVAHIQRRRGDMAGARELLASHLQKITTPEDWRLRHELAAVLDRLGEFDEAMRNLFLAKDQLRGDATPFLEQARAVRLRQIEIADQLTSADLGSWFGNGKPVDAPRRLAILCGHPRSGTTLLEQILAAHDDVVSTDETGVWQNEFLEPFMRRPATTAESLRELNNFDSEQIAAGRETYLRCTEAHLGESVRDRVLIEKDPSLTPDLPLPLRLFPETKIIFPARDPRDICVSYFFTIIPLNRISAHALDLKAAAEFCAHSFQMWRRWREILPSEKLEIRYEQLVSDTAAESRRVLEFLGLPWDERVLRFHEKSFSKGVRTPTYADVSQPIYKRAIGRWKNYARHLEPCLDVLESSLKEFGYE